MNFIGGTSIYLKNTHTKEHWQAVLKGNQVNLNALGPLGN